MRALYSVSPFFMQLIVHRARDSKLFSITEPQALTLTLSRFAVGDTTVSFVRQRPMVIKQLKYLTAEGHGSDIPIDSCPTPRRYVQ